MMICACCDETILDKGMVIPSCRKCHGKIAKDKPQAGKKKKSAEKKTSTNNEDSLATSEKQC